MGRLWGKLFDVLQLRGYDAVLIFLAFPFITPVPLPGFSTLFGTVIALLGLRMALAQRPWVPERTKALSRLFRPAGMGRIGRVATVLSLKDVP